jgi:D-alanyl-D-alanine carboxypeptidase/D-alanyl-D-alanine endopeptidase (penicillin-binding protein 7)
MLRPLVLAGLMFCAAAVHASSLALRSAHAVVVDEATGEVLLDKDGASAAPIASLTKLVTAMVVLDARQDPEEQLRVTEDDLDTLKHTHGGIRPGLSVSRSGLLELALIASDNHAAAALARNYPGGRAAFDAAVQRKIQQLQLTSTVIEEPTGLSPNNRSSALDMVKIMRAAAGYGAITDITSKRQHVVLVDGRRHYTVRNTNKLVGMPGWNILLSKTGFTNEAGRCLAMRVEAAGRNVAVVLMGAMGASQRTVDALNIRRWLTGEPVSVAAAAPTRRHAGAKLARAKLHVAAEPASPIVERVEPLLSAPAEE